LLEQRQLVARAAPAADHGEVAPQALLEEGPHLVAEGPVLRRLPEIHAQTVSDTPSGIDPVPVARRPPYARRVMVERVPHLASRLQGFGTTIFAEMTELAARTGAVNLGQGFPDEDGPPEVLDAAVEAIRSGRNQYPPGRGVPELRAAIARHPQRFYGLAYHPGTEVLVTGGAPEAIAAACPALGEPGDAVVVLEPTYDSYQASIAMAGARPVFVTLRPPDHRLDVDALRAAVTPRTRLLLVNTPHNPTGTVFDEAELAAVAELA